MPDYPHDNLEEVSRLHAEGALDYARRELDKELKDLYELALDKERRDAVEEASKKIYAVLGTEAADVIKRIERGGKLVEVAQAVVELSGWLDKLGVDPYSAGSGMEVFYFRMVEALHEVPGMRQAIAEARGRSTNRDQSPGR